MSAVFDQSESSDMDIAIDLSISRYPGIPIDPRIPGDGFETCFLHLFMQENHLISVLFSAGITEIRCAANPTGFTDSKRVGVKFFGFRAISSGTGSPRIPLGVEISGIC